METRRIARRARIGARSRALLDAVLQNIALYQVDRDVLDRAALVEPATLRSLDAIHLATAMSFGNDLGSLITYDHRLASAAHAAGIAVLTPAP